jgi:hypothetical protein
MYLRGLEVEATSGTQVLAPVILPYFDRTWRHFCSHQQSPSSGKAGHPAVVQRGRTIYFSHPLFGTYQTNAAPWCKRLFLNAVEMLLGAPLVRHNGPSTVQMMINEQPDQQRWVLHILHYIPEHRSTTVDVLEDVIPLHELEVSVRLPQPAKQVLAVPQKQAVTFRQEQDRVVFTLPKVAGHQMVELSYR